MEKRDSRNNAVTATHIITHQGQIHSVVRVVVVVTPGMGVGTASYC